MKNHIRLIRNKSLLLRFFRFLNIDILRNTQNQIVKRLHFIPLKEDAILCMEAIENAYHLRSIPIVQCNLSNSYLIDFQYWIASLPKIENLSLHFLLKMVEVLPSLDNLHGLSSIKFEHCFCLHHVRHLSSLKITKLHMVGCLSFIHAHDALPPSLQKWKIEAAKKSIQFFKPLPRKVDIEIDFFRIQ